MKALEIAVGGTTTDVHFWPEAAWPSDEWLGRMRAGAGRTVVVFDAAVRALAGTRLGELGEVAACSPASGEAAKRWQAVETIVETAMRAGLGRDGCLVGVGGGAVCDVAAFAASVYVRGVAAELVPTTLLAMVDASVGGKTAINFRGTKNVVGTFHPARRVDVHLGALLSLTERELRSGLAEVLKTALLDGEPFVDELSRHRSAFLARDPAAMAEAVRRCIAFKARVVSEDPTETGRRAVLNLGHTFGHALESVAGPGRLTHGEAVAWGMARAMELGVRLGHTPEAYRRQVLGLLRDYGYGLDTGALAPEAAGPAGAGRLLEAMRQDKKRSSGGLRFVLQRSLGDTVLVSDVPDREVLAVLAQEL